MLGAFACQAKMLFENTAPSHSNTVLGFVVILYWNHDGSQYFY